MAIKDLNDFELRLLKWISASDFIEVPWSTKRAADAFKVTEKEVYEALSSLTIKVKDNIQIFYEGGEIRIVGEV
jgi:hypothetical protein|tara:strand:+ start:84 stop:305 length:222 start_codon:yes stop_codon:yes gene_type:complete